MTLVAMPLAAAGCNDETPAAPSTTSARFSQRDLRVGTGAPTENGKFINVHYTGWLFDESRPDQKGLQFETSVGATPFGFVLGAGEVIAGWDQGLVGMRVGGLRRLVIPPSLGYGGVRNGPIPPFATLVFEIELLESPAETGIPYSISLRTASGNVLSVANNGNTAVLADKTSIGDWERFRLFDVNGGTLDTGDTVRIETTSGWGFVHSSNGTLAAIANPGQSFTQEQFVLESVSGGLRNGSEIALKALGTGLYVSAENGGGGQVTVTKTAVGSWETFTLIVH